MPIFELDMSFIDQVMASLVSIDPNITKEDVLKQYPKGLRTAYYRWKIMEKEKY